MSQNPEGVSMHEEVAANTIAERENISVLLEWAKHNPERVEGLLASFDTLVEKLNATLSGEVPEHLINVKALKKNLVETRFPTQAKMAEEEGQLRFITFVRAMKTMNEMMARGETSKEKPYLRFHTTTTNPEALAVGAIFHGYEEMMARDPRIGVFCANDQLVNALIEVLDSASELFPSLAEKDKLDWIDGYNGFSPEFRKSVGCN